MSRAARRGPWLPEEDRALLHLVQTQGPNNWVRISQQLQHRSPKQCRERYHQNLKPSLKHEPISAREGEIIERMVSEMGKRWAEIARHLGNRSDNAVKNWWNGSMNRRRRNPVQTSSGFKQMGSRIQPIPFAGTNRPSHHHFHLHHGLPRPMSPLRTSLAYSQSHLPPLAAPPPPSLSLPAPQHQRQPSHEYNPWTHARSLHVSTISDTPMSGHSSSQSYSEHPRSAFTRSTRSDFRPELPPLKQTSFPETKTTASLISPAISEVRQAPSLISDHLSTCSISPKTVTSPQPSVVTPWSMPAHPTELHYQPLDSTRQTSSVVLTGVNKIKDTRMHVSSLLE